jgi:hypothetical protein
VLGAGSAQAVQLVELRVELGPENLALLGER